MNPRGRGLILTQKVLAERGHHEQAQAIGAVRNRAHWSRYVADLIQRIQCSVRRFHDLSKLRFLPRSGCPCRKPTTVRNKRNPSCRHRETDNRSKVERSGDKGQCPRTANYGDGPGARIGRQQTDRVADFDRRWRSRTTTRLGDNTRRTLLMHGRPLRNSGPSASSPLPNCWTPRGRRPAVGCARLAFAPSRSVGAQRARSATDGPRLRPGSNPDNPLSKTCPCSSAAYPAAN